MTQDELIANLTMLGFNEWLTQGSYVRFLGVSTNALHVDLLRLANDKNIKGRVSLIDLTFSAVPVELAYNSRTKILRAVKQHIKTHA